MKLISWNIHGLGGAKKRSVRECISRCNPLLLLLQETDKEVMSVKLVKSSIGPKLSEWCALPVNGTSGGILFTWDLVEVKKVDEWMGNFLVTIKLVELSLGFEWMLSTVYGPCWPHSHADFWDELLTIKVR